MEDYRLEQSGQEVQNILNGAAMQIDLTAEKDRAELAERTLQGNIDDEASTRENADGELQRHIDDEEIRAKAAEKQNADDIDAIEEKIPSGASAQNKLATVVDLAAKQDVLTFDNAPTPNSTNPVTSGGVYTAIDGEKGARINADAALQQADAALQQAIEAILVLIPSTASALNQLADKSFVNSTVATASATFRGTYNLVSDLSLAVTATHAQIAAALAGAVSGADNNDYCFVQIPTSAGIPTEIRVTERYKFNGEIWAYEYDLNNSGFTAAQWEAINSAITSALVTKLSNLPDATQLANLFAGKQNTLTFDNAPVSGSSNPVKSGGIYDAIAAITAVIPSSATSSNKLVDLNALTAYVTGIIGALDASFDLTSTDGHVTLKMTQVDGVITTLQILTTDIASAQALATLGGQVSTNADDIAALQALYNALQQSAPEVIEPTDTWPVASPSDTVIYRVIDRVNTPPQYYSDYMFKADDLTTPVLMATYNNAIDPRPKKASMNLVTSGGVFDNMGALDVSELNATENPTHKLAEYATLSDALAAIPADYQKGGMSIKFVQSSSQSSAQSNDNRYVQYRLMADEWSTTVTDWQGVDKVPTPGSKNYAESAGIAEGIMNINTDIDGGLTFGASLFTDHKLIANDGTETYSPARNTTPFIPVKPGDVISWSGLQSGSTNYRSVALYDGNRNMLIGEGSSSASSSAPLSIGSNVRFAKFVAGVTATSQTVTIRRQIRIDSEAQRVNILYTKPNPLSIMTNTWSDNNLGTQKHIAVPVSPNDSIVVEANATVYYSLLKSYTPKYGDTPDFCTGYTGRQSSSSPLNITAPSDCQWLIVNYAEGSLSNPTSIVINNTEIINGYCRGVVVIEKNIVREEDFTFRPSLNLADPSNIMTDYNVGNYGNIAPSKGWDAIHIDVTSFRGQYICFGGFYLGRKGYYAFYNGNTIVTDAWAQYNDPNGGLAACVLVPDTATDLWFDIKTTESPATPYANLMVNVGTSLMPYEEFNKEIDTIKGYKIAGVGSGDVPEDIEEQIEAINNRLDNLDAGFIADLPVSSDGSDIDVGYAYIESATGIVKIKMS